MSGASFCDIDLSCAPGVQVGLCSITGTNPAPFAGHVLYINPDFPVALLAYDFMSQFSLPAPGPALPGAWALVLVSGLMLSAGMAARRRASARRTR